MTPPSAASERKEAEPKPNLLLNIAALLTTVLLGSWPLVSIALETLQKNDLPRAAYYAKDLTLAQSLLLLPVLALAWRAAVGQRTSRRVRQAAGMVLLGGAIAIVFMHVISLPLPVQR